MKLVSAIIASMFAVTAFAQAPAKKEEAKPAPAKVEKKAEVKPAKSPAKDEKATATPAPAAKPASK